MRASDSLRIQFNRIKELRDLGWNEKERLCNLFSERIWLLERKLSISPFDPARQTDPHGINSSFSTALNKWVEQFPSEHMLGALTLGLIINYITDEEIDSFLEACTDKITRNRSNDIARDIVRKKILPIPLTERSDIFGKFTHFLNVTGTSDRDKAPAGILENVLLNGAITVYQEAMGQPLPGYFDLPVIMKMFRDVECLIAEDWSLSGKTIASDVRTLLNLLKALFGEKNVQNIMAEKGYSPPAITVVVPFATITAIETISNVFSKEVCGFDYSPNLVVGFTFDNEDRIADDCVPEWVRFFQQAAPSINWNLQIDKTCEWFSDIAIKSGEHDLDFNTEKYGYGNSGWSIIGSRNCPDNSLPLYWQSIKANSFQPLFPRVSSKESHVGTSDEIKLQLEYAIEDKEGKLRQKTTAEVQSWPL